MAARRKQPDAGDSDEGCVGVTAERKYYALERAFIKRSLRRNELRTNFKGLIHVPRFRKASLKNEAESLRYIRQHTDIPVPTVYCAFEDTDAYYLITENIKGKKMSDLQEDQKDIVRKELQRHLATLKTLKSNRMGGPTGIVIPPYRVVRQTETDNLHLKTSNEEEYVFCHNDLSQYNILVDPESLKINAIVDWEFAGFWPARFEFPFYNRLGPSVAIAKEGEVDDSRELLAYIKSRSEQQE